MSRALAIALLLVATLVAAAAPGSARAAQSYDACDYFIDVLPATVSAPGTWCLTNNLTTNASGFVIDVTVDDVTIDCNGYRIDGSSRTQTVYAAGVSATYRSRVTVRNCHVRGFSTGIILASDVNIAQVGQHLVEDNRVDRCTEQAIVVQGDDSVVRRNLVLETTNNTSGVGAFGITAYGKVDVLDNTVSGVRSFNGAAGGLWIGSRVGGSIRGNLVRGVKRNGASGSFYGMYLGYSGERKIIRDNTFVGEALAGSIGMMCDSFSNHARNNTVMGFTTGIAGCTNDGNLIKP